MNTAPSSSSGSPLLLAFRDDQWLTKCIRQTILSLVPVVGWVALLSWQRRVFRAAREQASQLPTPTNELRDGAPVVVAMIVLLAAPGVPLAIAAAALATLNMRVSGWLPPEVLQVVLTIYGALVYPEVLRRALAHGERFALLRPMPSIRAIARSPADYAIAVGLTFVALLVACFGLNMCLVGGIVTVPLAHAMAASVAARWQEAVERASAPTTGAYR